MFGNLDRNARPGENTSPISVTGRSVAPGYGSYFDTPAMQPSFVEAVSRHKKKIILAGVLGGLISFAITIPQTRIYRSHVSLEFTGFNGNLMDTRDVDPSATADNSSQAYINTQARVLESEPLLRRVIDNVKAKESHAPAKNATDSELLSRLNTATLSRAIDVRPVDGTKLIDIYIQSPDAGLSTELANTLATEYMAQNVENRWSATQLTSDWLNKQLAEAKDRLEKSEANLQEYARRSNLVFTGAEGGSVSEARLREIQDEYSKAQADRTAKESVYDQLSSEDPEDKTASLHDPTLTDYQLKLSELNQQMADLSTVYAPGNQKVRRIESQIEELKKDYERQHSSALTRVKSDFDTAKRREAMLASAFHSQQNVVTTDAAKAVDYNILKREAETNRSIYEGMLQKVKSYNIASAIQPSSARVVDPAERPLFPYKPNVAMTTMFGTMGGLMLALIWTGIRDRGIVNIHYPGQTKLFLQTPELGTIPTARLDPYLTSGRTGRISAPERNQLTQVPAPFLSSGVREPAVLHKSVETATWFCKSSLLAESVRSIRTSLLCGDGTSSLQTLVVTSLGPAHGKTSFVSNLAIAMAEIGRRVLMIDADLRNPTLHRTFALQNEEGLATLLQDDPSFAGADPHSMIQRTAVPNLSLLSGGKYTDPAASTLFHSRKMANLLASLRPSFDTILIDTPPLILSDARILAPLSDGVIIVLRAGNVKMESVLAAEARLMEDGSKVIGTVLNDWDPRSNGYGSYPDRYHKGSYFRSTPV